MYFFVYYCKVFFSRRNTRLLFHQVCEAYRFVEFFAGDANVTWAMRQWGLAGIALDYSYGGRFNNIFEPAGFASLAQFIHQFFVETLRKLSCSQGPLKMLIFFWGGH